MADLFKLQDQVVLALISQTMEWRHNAIFSWTVCGRPAWSTRDGTLNSRVTAQSILRLEKSRPSSEGPTGKADSKRSRLAEFARTVVTDPQRCAKPQVASSLQNGRDGGGHCASHPSGSNLAHGTRSDSGEMSSFDASREERLLLSLI